jgi:hypothetical protein
VSKHWHVLIGLRGLYMPDANYAFTSRKQARQAAADFAEQEREGAECEGHESTEGPAGIATYCDGSCIVTRHSADFYTIGNYRSIEVTDCDMPWSNCKDCD